MSEFCKPAAGFCEAGVDMGAGKQSDIPWHKQRILSTPAKASLGSDASERIA